MLKVPCNAFCMYYLPRHVEETARTVAFLLSGAFENDGGPALTPEQVDRLAADILECVRPTIPDPDALAAALIARGWRASALALAPGLMHFRLELHGVATSDNTFQAARAAWLEARARG